MLYATVWSLIFLYRLHVLLSYVKLALLTFDWAVAIKKGVIKLRFVDHWLEDYWILFRDCNNDVKVASV